MQRNVRRDAISRFQTKIKLQKISREASNNKREQNSIRLAQRPFSPLVKRNKSAVKTTRIASARGQHKKMPSSSIIDLPSKIKLSFVSPKGDSRVNAYDWQNTLRSDRVLVRDEDRYKSEVE